MGTFLIRKSLSEHFLNLTILHIASKCYNSETKWMSPVRKSHEICEILLKLKMILFNIYYKVKVHLESATLAFYNGLNIECPTDNCVCKQASSLYRYAHE